MSIPLPPPGPLFDRAGTLREIQALLAEALARRESLVVRVAGPPGIGKTVILSYFATQWPAGTIYVPLKPSAQTDQGGAIRRAVDQAAVHGGATSLEGLRAVLRTGVLLCIDDAQWLDERSVRWLRLTCAAERDRLTVILTDRREDAPELPPHRTASLGPLRRRDAMRLVRHHYPGAADDVVAEIVDASDGLPFAIAFLACESARRSARTRAEADTSVRSAVRLRLERCSPHAREAARYCSLLGEPADVRIVARALDVPPERIDAALDELSELVARDHTLARFRHSLIADAVKAGIANAMTYNRRLCAVLDAGDERPQTLATVLRCATAAAQDDLAMNAALRLGRLLAGSGALATALDVLRTGLSHAGYPIATEYAVEYAGVLQQLALDRDAGEFLRAELRQAIDRRDAVSAAALLRSYGAVTLTLERDAEFAEMCTRIETSTHASTGAARADVESRA